MLKDEKNQIFLKKKKRFESTWIKLLNLSSHKNGYLIEKKNKIKIYEVQL